MFGKLKAKLKETLSFFSKKAKEATEEKVSEESIEKKDEKQEPLHPLSKPIPEKSQISEKKNETISAPEIKKAPESKRKEVIDQLSQAAIKEEKKRPEEKEQEDKKQEKKQKPLPPEPVRVEEVKEREKASPLEKDIPKPSSVPKAFSETISKTPAKAQPPQPQVIREPEHPKKKETEVKEELKKEESRKEKHQQEKKEQKIEEKKKSEEEEKIKSPIEHPPTPLAQSTFEQPKESPPEPLPKRSFFGKIKEAFTTKTISAEKFEELFWELEVAMLENNVSVKVIERIKEDLQQVLVNKPLPRDVESVIAETLKKTLSDILEFKSVDIIAKAKEKNEMKKPYIIAFFGINGAGKTTSIAKLAWYFQRQGLSVVLAAGDTFRAAAIQQLQEHADKLGVKMIKQDYGSDAAAVAFDAVRYAEKNAINIVLIDTAGRLHSNTNLMAELQKLIRVSKPDLKIFVGESITGNDCIEQARQFNELVEQDGIILTKADVDEKGGAPLSISYVIKKPILFLGMGQRYEDLEVFNKEKMLQRLGL